MKLVWSSFMSPSADSFHVHFVFPGVEVVMEWEVTEESFRHL